MIKRLTDEHVFGSLIVTEVTPASMFYKAEDYHQNYFENNPGNPHCAALSNPGFIGLPGGSLENQTGML